MTQKSKKDAASSHKNFQSHQGWKPKTNKEDIGAETLKEFRKTFKENLQKERSLN